MKPTYLETWGQMAMRHERERKEQVLMLCEDYTQTEAAKILDVTLQSLNNYVRRNKLIWKKVEQGRRSRQVYLGEEITKGLS